MSNNQEILVEEWTSGDAEEHHIFLKNDQRGYAYVLGYNPRLFSKDEVADFLGKKGISLG